MTEIVLLWLWSALPASLRTYWIARGIERAPEADMFFGEDP